MSVKRYIQTDADSRYDWIAMLEKQNSYEIVASIKDSRVLLYRNKDKQKSIDTFKYLAHKHGAVSATIPFRSFAMA